MKNIDKIFKGVTKKQTIEFGLVAVFVTSFLALYLERESYILAVFILSLLTLVLPVVFYPFAVFWLGLSRVLNAISSRVLLTLIFFIVVTPVGYFRRMSGSDSMNIKQFKKSRRSVMIVRNHRYVPGDFINTF